MLNKKNGVVWITPQAENKKNGVVWITPNLLNKKIGVAWITPQAENKSYRGDLDLVRLFIFRKRGGLDHP